MPSSSLRSPRKCRFCYRCRYKPPRFDIDPWRIKILNTNSYRCHAPSSSLRSPMKCRFGRHKTPRFDIDPWRINTPLANSHSPPAHTSPSAHLPTSQTTTHSSAINTTSSRHTNTRIPYTFHPALSPSTSPPPTHPHHRSHPGIQFRKALSTRGWASSSSRHLTTPSCKSIRSCSYMFPPSRAARRLPPPTSPGHYSTPRSTPPRCRRFASRPRPPNSHRHATTPSSFRRSHCFPPHRHLPPTFRFRISQCESCQAPHSPQSSAPRYYWSSMTTRHHTNTPSDSSRRRCSHRVSPRHPPQSGNSGNTSGTTMSPPRRCST